MRDINRYRRIVEDVEIPLDDNDAISLRLWVDRLQEGGAECFLKDKKDPAPPASGLAQETFVLCIQSKFQRDRFLALGKNFVSIDATHNTTHYPGILLFTLLVRDLWGHGTLCRFVAYFHFWITRLHHRYSHRLDVVVRRHGSDDQIFFEFRKIPQPGDLACNNHDGLRQGTDECH